MNYILCECDTQLQKKYECIHVCVSKGMFWVDSLECCLKTAENWYKYVPEAVIENYN